MYLSLFTKFSSFDGHNGGPVGGLEGVVHLRRRVQGTLAQHTGISALRSIDLY